MSRLNSQVYILDADSWIACYEECYPPDVFPGIWDRIRDAADEERIKTPRQALKEAGNESKGVSAWIRAIQPSIVLQETTSIVSKMNDVIQKFPTLTRGIEESADPWLVAHAMALSDAVVVTEELRSLGGRPKVPNVCTEFGVQSINLLTMFRRLTFKLK